MDDSGFYAGEITHCALQQGASFLSWCLEPVLSPGGPVPQVGVTIAMDDELLNGTNRVVLDGVMTEKECERILHLANVSSERETRPFRSKKRGLALTYALISDRLRDLPGMATEVEGLRTHLMRRLRV